MAEIARNIMSGHQLVMKCALIRLVSYAEKVCRNRLESVFREIIGAWLLSHLLPQKLLWWQACFVSIVSRSMFVPALVLSQPGFMVKY